MLIRIWRVALIGIGLTVLTFGAYIGISRMVIRHDNLMQANLKVIRLLDGLRPNKFPGSWSEMAKYQKKIEERYRERQRNK